MTAKDQVVDEIRNVLRGASAGKGAAPHYVTTYQVIARLPKSMREALIAEHGKVGAGAGSWTSAATYVASLLKNMSGVEYDYFDTRDTKFCLDESDEPRAGNPVCGIWRLKREAPST
ncbi:MAG TPA: hypothetical protein VGG39_14660 [Polyangiaceae bacterium]|jgi:hypothetical protein